VQISISGCCSMELFIRYCMYGVVGEMNGQVKQSPETMVMSPEHLSKSI
jgi:hypothetical protein